MNNFFVCFNAVLPILISLIVGYLAQSMKMLNRQDVEKFNRIAFNIFCPIMVFYNIYCSDLEGSVNYSLLLFAGLGILAAFALSSLYAKVFIKDLSYRSVIIQGLFRSNFVVIGLAIATNLVEDGDASVVTVLLAVVVPLFNAFSVICLNAFSDKKTSGKDTFLKIIKNPLIISCVLGIVFKASGWRLPAVAEKVVSDFADVASPLMLFLLGAFFRFDNVFKYIREIVIVGVGRLLVIPALFLPLAYFLGFRGLDFAALIAVFGSSSAATSFTMAQQMGGDADLAGNIIVVTSLLCPLTVFLWSMIFKSLGAF